MASRQDWLLQALDRHEGPLVRYARGLVGDLETARDLAQECFLRLCRERPERLDGHLRAWLFAVCRSRAIDHLRKEGRMKALDEPPPGAGDDPAARAERMDDERSLLRAMRELPLRQQEVLRLKFQEGMSYREIGEVTRNSVANVGFLLHTALKTLRARMGAPRSLS